MNSQGGVVTSPDAQGVPIFERFFLGGIFDVRGYRLRTIGPRLPAPARRSDPNAAPSQRREHRRQPPVLPQPRGRVPDPRGGGHARRGLHRRGNVWNLEAQYCDAGGTGLARRWSRPLHRFQDNPSNLRFSWGFGVRWQSPLGPLRFEWGFPLNRLPYEESSVFEFTIGNFF
jgi:outer membrane protein insertion porin family